MREIAVIVPVIERPEAAKPFMDSWRAATEGHSSVYAITHAGDTETIAAWRAEKPRRVLRAAGPRFADKVDAGYRWTREPWLLIVGDDVTFHEGWESAALRAGKQGAVVSTNDCHRTDLDQLAIHPMFSRSYLDLVGATVDGPKTITSKEYFHQYIDQEWSNLARARGELVYAPRARIAHNHPIFVGGEGDPIYVMAQEHAERDRETCIRRLYSYWMRETVRASKR